MNEIKVGEYIRTRDGLIAKVIALKENPAGKPNTYFELDKAIIDRECFLYRIEKVKYIDITYKEDLEQIKKHSPNIIDLIEVGDYVNGYKVSDKESTLLCTNVKGIDRSGYHIPISQYGEGIETIVTKEQFASMEYKVSD